jgi:hypothetical protein
MYARNLPESYGLEPDGDGGIVVSITMYVKTKIVKQTGDLHRLPSCLRTRPIERPADYLLEEELMAKMPGCLLADLHPNGTVRIVFIASNGGGNETPFTAKNLDAAEVIFMTCGLTPIRAAEIRAELERNSLASVRTSMDDAVAAKFRHPRGPRWRSSD